MRSGRRGFPTFGQGMMVALLVVGVQLALLPAITGHVLSNGLAVVAMRLHARIPGITTEGFYPWWLTALGVLVTAGGIVAFHRATLARLARADKGHAR